MSAVKTITTYTPVHLAQVSNSTWEWWKQQLNDGQGWLVHSLYIIQDFCYDAIISLIEPALSPWLTSLSCHYLSSLFSWLITASLGIGALILVLQLLGKVGNALVYVIFVWTSDTMVSLVRYFFTGVGKSLWYLITFIPRKLLQLIGVR